MQRIFYSANPDPVAFWTSTFDEVLLVIQGKVDDQRTQRRNAYNLYCSWAKDPIPITDFNPLPFDDEIQKTIELTQQDIDEHLKRMANFEWPASSKN